MKYPGGKSSELKIINKYQPEVINNYIEPFVGGGAVFFDILPKNKSFINDNSKELMLYYKALKNNDQKFINFLEKINNIWIETSNIITKNKSILINKFYINTNEELTSFICDSLIITNASFAVFNEEYDNVLISKIKKSLSDKMKRTVSIANKNNGISNEDLVDNIESGIKSGIYTFIRFLFNNYKILNIDDSILASLYFFIREYSYSSMFRYNKKGFFNVPYGGISYNKKNLTTKINMMKSKDLSEKMSYTELYNTDFEVFLNSLSLNSDDFIFLDPPYDSDFSTYSNNQFNLQDHKRLRDFCQKTNAKFLLVIKNTDYIYDLYKEFYIFSFDKKYSVSFMNRNNRNVNHLLITNYQI
ncbi:DNA adenine methylase [Staphylococcus hominis]